MLEDARDCWTLLPDRVEFKFVQCSSSVSSTCVPTVTGDRLKVAVHLPLLPNAFQVLFCNFSADVFDLYLSCHTLCNNIFCIF